MTSPAQVDAEQPNGLTLGNPPSVLGPEHW
jgi:hypothetical protein